MATQIIHKLFDKFPRKFKKFLVPSCFDVAEFIAGAAGQMPPDSLILDAGAGQCLHKSFFQRQRYIAIDAAYGDASWNYTNLDIIGDTAQLPFANNCFDYIICTQVLEHVKEPQALLCEAFRVLKPEGVIYLSAPQGWCVHQSPHDYFRFTNHALQYLFDKAGFNTLYIKPSCGYFAYIANRLAFLPKVLFGEIGNPFLRFFLLPLEVLSYLIFVIILPLIFNSIDFLDQKREFTLNYFVKAIKPIRYSH